MLFVSLVLCSIAQCVTRDNLDTLFYMLKLFRTPRIPILRSKTGINRGDTIFIVVIFAPKQDFGYPLEPSLIAVFTSTHNLSLEQK